MELFHSAVSSTCVACPPLNSASSSSTVGRRPLSADKGKAGAKLQEESLNVLDQLLFGRPFVLCVDRQKIEDIWIF